MTKLDPVKDMNQGKRKAVPRRILQVMGQPAGWNPLNENLPQNKSSYLLQLDPSKLIYEEKTTKQIGKKKGLPKIYSIRGFRELLRQRSLADMQEGRIDPCQTLSDERYFSAQVSLTEQEEP
ncbi:MAG: hypothetical protein ACFFGZ_03290 [Candidatus Thorarchaeota archaeon]